MKTILLSIPYGMSARNFLRSDVLRTLKKQANVLIVSPLGDNQAFKEEFSAPNVRIVSIPHTRSLPRSILSRILFPLQAYWFTQKTRLTTLLCVKDLLRKSNPVRYAVYCLMGETLGRIGAVRRWLTALFFKSIRNPEIEKLLRQNQVDLVFTTHGFVALEMELAVQAADSNIPMVNMVHSWDNLTSKSGLRQMTNDQVGTLLPVQFYDRVIVWNEILRDELRDLYGFPEDRIFISGVPQFDPYPVLRQTSNRENYLKSMGADPAKRTIFFIATSPSLIFDQTSIVRDFLQAFRAGRFVKDCQVFIRTHPGSDMSDWLDLFKGPGVFFQQPTAAFTPKEIKTWEGKDENPLALAEAILHCDVMINGISTTAIEAAVFDRPCICMGYDGDPAHNTTVPLLYKNTHYEKIVRTQGFRIAWTGEDLIQLINLYLEHPELDRDGRELIRRQQCFQLDGQSGKRVADYLLKMAGG